MKRAIVLLLLLAVALLALAGCERKVTNTVVSQQSSAACMTCHSDNTAMIIKAQGEWATSVHASGENVDYTNRAGAACPGCHNDRGFIDRISGRPFQNHYDSAAAIHCFTCHAPHTSGTLALRGGEKPVTLDNGAIFDDGAGNLCALCHHALGAAPKTTDTVKLSSSRWGPHHSMQSDMVLGTNGYQYAGYTYPTQSTHMIVEDVCKGCHMYDTTVHNGYGIGGHSMRMEDEAGNSMVPSCGRTQGGTNGTTCHPVEAKAAKTFAQFKSVSDTIDLDHNGVVEPNQIEMQGLLDTLQNVLVAAHLLKLTNGEYLIDTTGHTSPGVKADSAGAAWNWLIVTGDRCLGIHNWKYETALIRSSINYLKTGNPTTGGF